MVAFGIHYIRGIVRETPSGFFWVPGHLWFSCRFSQRLLLLVVWALGARLVLGEGRSPGFSRACLFVVGQLGRRRLLLKAVLAVGARLGPGEGIARPWGSLLSAGPKGQAAACSHGGA